MSIIKAMMEGYYEAKAPKRLRNEFEWLVHEQNPLLKSSEELSRLYAKATNTYQEDCILEHMNRHAAWEVESYRKLEQKIIDERWNG